jgi:hypothetical protein
VVEFPVHVVRATLGLAIERRPTAEEPSHAIIGPSPSPAQAKKIVPTAILRVEPNREEYLQWLERQRAIKHDGK